MKLSRWRIAVLAFFFLAPFLALIVYAFYALWEEGWSLYASLILIASVSVGYYLAYRWQASKKLLRVDFDEPLHWTDRDKQAWKLVEARAQQVNNLEADKLVEMNFYTDTGKEMALELARIYHPKAADPIASLTIPEILAVVELASHDLAEMVEKYLPGGHLLTVRDWKRAKQAADWYETASNVYWGVSAIFAPYSTALRYLATKVGMSTPLQLLQQNLLQWFYTAYVHRLGTYLIDLNSGRLRVGAERYRQFIQSLKHKEAKEAAEHAIELEGKPLPMAPVTITLMGQVKAGKSSLINAFLGEERAKTSVLPATGEITRYELKTEEDPEPLILQDTVGYGNAGPSADQLRTTQKAAQQSDLLLLVLHGRNPARQADLEMLKKLKEYFDKNPALKLPPILAVMTHVDLLTPAMEWDPPYDWQNPKRPKEKNIEQAIATVREQLGEYLSGAVPVCTAPGKVYGIEEFLLPAVTNLLDQSRAVSMLRSLHAEADMNKVRRVFDQALSGGKELLKALWGPGR
jgi:predicted GTPase